MNKRTVNKITMASFFVSDIEEQTPTAVLVENISNGEYHQSDRLSKSKLALFCKSPVEYYHTYITGLLPKQKSNAAMDVGSICHAVLLEGADLNDIVAVVPSNCYKSNGHLNSVGESYKAFASDNAGKMIVRSIKDVTAILDAVRGSELQDIIKESSHRERVIHWTECVNGVDLECQCKPDFFIELDDMVVCYDLKFSPSVSDDDFSRTNRRFRYWLQDAHYSAGLRALFGKPVQFRFWVVEPQFPFRISVKTFSHHTRETSAAVWQRKLGEFVEARESGIYQDNWSGEIVMNAWDFEDGAEMESSLEITDG